MAVYLILLLGLLQLLLCKGIHVIIISHSRKFRHLSQYITWSVNNKHNKFSYIINKSALLPHSLSGLCEIVHIDSSNDEMSKIVLENRLKSNCTVFAINTHSNDTLSTFGNSSCKLIKSMQSVDVIWAFGEAAAFEYGNIEVRDTSAHVITKIPMIVTINTHHKHMNSSNLLSIYNGNAENNNSKAVYQNNVWYEMTSDSLMWYVKNGNSWITEKSFMNSYIDKQSDSKNNKGFIPTVMSSIVAMSSILSSNTSKEPNLSMLERMSLCLINQLHANIDTSPLKCPLSEDMLPDQPVVVIGHESYTRNKVPPHFCGTNDRPLIVASMTTTPKRLAEINGPLSETISRLIVISQLDRIYINIPWKYSLRKTSDSVEVPKVLVDMMENVTFVGKVGRLRVVRSKDWGPSTKLLPILLLSHEDLPLTSRIITFDDDRLYTKETVAALVDSSDKYPQSIITNAGWHIEIISSGGRRGIRQGPVFHSKIPMRERGEQFREPGRVDLLLGFFGVLYRKSFFDPLPLELFNYTASPKIHDHCTMVDDIWFSGHMERMGIARRVFGRVPNTAADVTELTNVNALSLEGKKESEKQNNDNVHCAEAMAQLYGIWK